jgi:hypothetical membrane protein
MNDIASRAGGVCGAAAPVVFVVAVVLSSVLQDDYSWRREYISGLSADTAQHPWVMIAGFVVAGACVVGFAWSLDDMIRRSRWSLAGPVLLTAGGIGLVGVGLLRNDCSDALAVCKAQLERHNSWHGTAHDLVSIPTFFCLVAGPLTLAARMRRDERWRWVAKLTFACFPIIAVVMVVDGLEVSDGWGGIVQRTHVLMLAAWTEVVAWRLLRLVGETTPRSS